MDRELQIAYAIQTKLLPERMPEIRNADLFARSIPARKVGGDYFDFFPIDDRRWGLAIGDVSGKGVPAALLMVMLRSLLRAKAIESTSSAVVVSKVNRMILPDIDPMMFATLFYGIYDSETREFTYTNAGHNYPFCHRRGGDISELETDNLIVGMFDDYAYNEKRVLLSPGDRIVFYTDGITEAKNEAGEMFGIRRLRDLLEQPGEHPSQSEVQRIFTDVSRFAGDQPQYDDMTLMLLQVR
jgi:sigma-B regulation protein RsbU (phosphoserine phosphatase)